MSTTIGRLLQLALVGVFVTSAVVLVRVSRLEAMDAIPFASAEGAVETYRNRIDATYRLLETGELTLESK
ncbi:MAG: hypothetical protein JSU73_01950 [candidate division WOR-3 bacterium]|nr:MAG: hypothetical protein JSU73_01950 [candidate division WOR-3 bacterium]